MRSLSPTATAVGVAALRALYSDMPAPLGFVSDPFAARLLPRPMGALTRIVRARPTLARFVHRALRIVTRDLSLSTPLRTLAIDDALRVAIEGGARQFVLLGSGLDSRAWRCRELANASVFELDRAPTHEYKKARMRGVQIVAARHAYVPVDFERDELSRVLLQAGFNPEVPTVWLWEGVIIYLPHQATHGTIRVVASMSAPGSSLIATYTCPGLGGAGRPTVHLRLGARLVGEPIAGEVSTRDLHAWLSQHGLQVDRDEPVNGWAPRVMPHGELLTGPDWERVFVASKR